MDVKIKICGIRRAEDVEIVNKYKPDYIGMILASGFRRTVGIDEAKAFLKDLCGDIKRVGVFVDTPIAEVLRCREALNLDVIQLHGNENARYIKELNAPCEVWKAVRVRDGKNIERVEYADKILLDKYDAKIAGGTGKTFAAGELGKINTNQPIILAGGLSEENVLSRIDTFKPYGVDVSSAVETDGVKDEEKIRKFISIVKGMI